MTLEESIYDRIKNRKKTSERSINSITRTLVDLEKEALLIDSRLQQLSISPLFESRKIAGTLFTSSLLAFFIAKQIQKIYP